MLDGARAAGSDQRDITELAHGDKLLDVVTPTHPIAGHAVENDFSRAALLCFANPVERIATGAARMIRVSCELIHAVAVGCGLTIDPHYHALRAKAGAQGIDEIGIG